MISTQNRIIVDEDGMTTQEFVIWLAQVTDLQIATGAGSPEGVLVALIGKEYMDTAGIAGAIKYIKRDADVAGDKSKGWILV